MESILWQLILNQAIMQQHPQTSTNFSLPAALDWLDAILESNAILSTILAVIHPQLYDAGWQTAKHLRDTPEIDPQDVLSQWASVFSGVAIISNCSTLVHMVSHCKVHAGEVRRKSLWIPSSSFEFLPQTAIVVA